jgi:hypothetical protein
VQTGQTTTLSWSGVTGATICSIDNGVGVVPCADGNASANPLTTTTYTLTARSAGASATRSTTVTVTQPAGQTFAAAPSFAQAGDAVTLSWSAYANATACSINNGVGSVSCAGGAVLVRPTATTTYALSITSPTGTTTESTTVTIVSGSLEFGPNSFGGIGPPNAFPVPQGVTHLTIQAFGGPGRSSSTGPGGLGGSVTATVSVTPGEILYVVVPVDENINGGPTCGLTKNGTTSGPGGFGGNSSDVREGGSDISNRIVVAGGGGGGGSAGAAGGAGGGTVGVAGGGTGGQAGGAGGTQSGGGAGGVGSVTTGSPGQLQRGGAGGGGDGPGAEPGVGDCGGGGGGGYFGGGGGGGGGTAGSPGAAGGGGGSSFVIPTATNVTHTQGTSSGAKIVLSW